ncbi:MULTISPECIES: MlaD family protein [unclassified Novosphingobium]|uniref:MlaD family protein n=1 Tax=unclassified Novosphingobium TaxID=2644732 RepID=UPI0025D97516|nr:MULTISPECIES: MlaD family protein [unclassified Novosphingobium]HQV03448.1 MlaD family protein [Novosphingobium sp.]
METKAKHVWVGAVTLGLLALILAVIVWIARLNEGNKREFDIFFKQSVDGLSKGSAVSFQGVAVGQVTEIELWTKDPGFVRVRIAVEKGTPIRVGTTATMQGSFTGVSNIQLEGANKDAPELTCKGEQAGACPEGVPVIPTKRGGLGELLNSAPVLLERLATLTERLSLVFSDKNLAAIDGILANTNRASAGLADTTPQMRATLAELQLTLADARKALVGFEQVAGTTNDVLNGETRQMLAQFRQSLKSIEVAADNLNGLIGDTRPAARELKANTLPQAEAAIRDLRATTKSLRDLTEKVNSGGAGSLLGGQKLPDYKPRGN